MGDWILHLVFLLFLNSLVYGQRDRCETTTRQLVAHGCSVGCVTVTRKSFPCPVCDLFCSVSDAEDECSPRNSSSCSEESLCLASGVAGRYTCVDHLREGQGCIITTIDPGLYVPRIINGRVSRGSVSDVAIPCRSGLVCRRESLLRSVCLPERSDLGPCAEARMRDDELICDADGNYEPLQCSRITDSTLHRCRCVNSSGMVVADSEQEVTDPRRGPDCVGQVRSRCRYESNLGFSYEVRSGTPFVVTSNCSRCLCDDGVATLCETLQNAAVCRAIDPMPTRNETCMFRGQTLQNLQILRVGCNLCKCGNGRVRCTRRACQELADTEDEDNEADIGEDPMDGTQERNCRMCARERAQPVCGNDRRTYISACYARNCRGLDTDDISAGRCSQNDVCGQAPCRDGETCSKRGGVTCLSRSGCRPERLRNCVNLTTLACRTRATNTSEDDVEDEEGMVCGDDGTTYPSLCNLLQNAGGIQVAYAGRCNRQECGGGQVCGTDNETYSNICELQANSANARVDYRGACMDAGDVVDDRCRRLRASGRCPSLGNCTSRVQPEDGCCTVCGGAITIGLDQEGLDEYVNLNPTFQTIDDFVAVLIADDFIPERIVQHCRITANLLDTGDLHMVMENTNDSSSDTCHMFVKTMADEINNPPNASTNATAALPQILQFVTVAQTATVVENAPQAVDKNSSATKVVAYFTLASILLFIVVFS